MLHELMVVVLGTGGGTAGPYPASVKGGFYSAKEGSTFN